MRTLPLVFCALILVAGCAEQVISTMQAGNEIAMIMDMRSLHIGQTQFMMQKQRYGTIDDLRAGGFVGPAIASGKKHGYTITLVSADARSYVVRADPDPENKLDLRHFYLDQTGVIRANHMKPAGPNDPPAKQ